MPRTPARPPFAIADQVIPPGRRQRLEIPVARLPTGTWVSMPCEVMHGRRPGPVIWLSAALHGDELNGVEIISRVLALLDARRLVGTVVAVPIVNVFGLINESRYLPDRRDLNRCFPGSPRGSLASRLAHLFMREVVERCSYGIDLHTGSDHRKNLPQVRVDLGDVEAQRCAAAFGAPVVLHARTRDGSLRQAASERGIHVLVYEAGAALRFNATAIDTGVAGVMRVLATLGMVAADTVSAPGVVRTCGASSWLRARKSGLLRLEVELGDEVRKGQRLGVVADVFGQAGASLSAPMHGTVIGVVVNPLVNQGEAVVHIAAHGSRSAAEKGDP